MHKFSYRSELNADLGKDLAHLSELPPSYSPEFLMRVTTINESSDCASLDDEIPPAPAHGTYRAIRDTLASKNQIEDAVKDFRSMLNPKNDCKSDDERHALIETWIAVEPSLTDTERNELFANVVGLVFPGSQMSVSPSRGGHAQAEGE